MRHSLSEDRISVGRNGESGKEITLGCNRSVGSESFSKDIKYVEPHLFYQLTALISVSTSATPGFILASGTLDNFSTIKVFRAADKAALFNQSCKGVSRLCSMTSISTCIQIWEHVL